TTASASLEGFREFPRRVIDARDRIDGGRKHITVERGDWIRIPYRMEDASAWHHAIVGQQPQEPLGPLLLFFRGFDCGDALGDTGPELRGRLFEERSIAAP